MSDIKYTFVIDGEEWKECHLERMAYERNLHILHQMKQHRIEIIDKEKVLNDDEIDYLTAEKAWEVSKQVRGNYSGQEMIEYYKDSFKKSDEMWKKAGLWTGQADESFKMPPDSKGTYAATIYADHAKMQQDESVLLGAHPEHFTTIVTDTDITGIEPFGMYGTPTLVHVKIADVSDLGTQIQKDRLADYPIATTGKAYLTDNVTEINTPFHQLKPTDNGFEAELAVYWPAGVPDELVTGHSLHLAMEFYECLKTF